MLGEVVAFFVEIVGEAVGEVFRPKAGPGMCARCRKQPGEVTVAGAGDQRVCVQCAHVVARNHRAGELFFIGLAGLMGVMSVVLIVRDVQRGAPTPASNLLLLLAVGVALPAAAAWGIRVASRPTTRTAKGTTPRPF